MSLAKLMMKEELTYRDVFYYVAPRAVALFFWLLVMMLILDYGLPGTVLVGFYWRVGWLWSAALIPLFYLVKLQAYHELGQEIKEMSDTSKA